MAQEVIGFIVNRIGVIVFLFAIGVAVFVLMNGGPKAVGKVFVYAILVLILFQCMLGIITPDEAAKKTKDELNPLGVLNEGSRLATERGLKRHNQCLKDYAIENKLGKFVPNCAGITGKEYEACAKVKIYNTDPDAWGRASVECGDGAGRIVDQVIGYSVAIIRKVSGCPESKLELCSNKTKAELEAEAAKLAAEAAEKRRVCIERVVETYQLGKEARPCYYLKTRTDWEVCVNNLLCPSPAEKNRCAWVDSCQKPK